ncbi:hypothetical protein QVD17_21156 [Tagetes erecta]|uniref:Uncharacterized protein n=1 Tax=Tagetes erecta TaxID=13708 RepID=A0AAD8KR76_TARER|nr:hypothetical protein QVD17_21156 [Tagetes erecta]
MYNIKKFGFFREFMQRQCVKERDQETYLQMKDSCFYHAVCFLILGNVERRLPATNEEATDSSTLGGRSAHHEP